MPAVRHDLVLDEANLISSWLEGILLGMHCVLYGFCIRVLWVRRGQRSSRILMVVTTVMLILALAHVALSLRGLLEAFVWHYAGADATMYYLNFSTTVYRLKDTIYVGNSFIADALMVWRVYAVWGADWRAVVVPVLLYAGCIVTGVRSMVVLWEITPAQSLFIVTLTEWITSLWAVSLGLNIFCTTMIIVRIARMSMDMRAYRGIIVIIIESGALYTVSVGLLMCMYDLKANIGQIMGDIATQLSVIAPTLIIVRVGARMLETHSSTGKRTLSSTTASFPMFNMQQRTTALDWSGRDATVVINVASEKETSSADDDEKADAFASSQRESSINGH